MQFCMKIIGETSGRNFIVTLSTWEAACCFSVSANPSSVQHSVKVSH
jgi:hypothetical protein